VHAAAAHALRKCRLSLSCYLLPFDSTFSIPKTSFMPEHYSNVFLARQVLGGWDAGPGAAVEVPAHRLPPGRYLLQLALAGAPGAAASGQPDQPEVCGWPPGAAALGLGPLRGGERGDPIAWRLCVAPAADERACSVAEDDSRARYIQARRRAGDPASTLIRVPSGTRHRGEVHVPV
jgi:hypothetical protein